MVFLSDLQLLIIWNIDLQILIQEDIEELKHLDKTAIALVEEAIMLTGETS
jgi:hypothetical protein